MLALTANYKAMPGNDVLAILFRSEVSMSTRDERREFIALTEACDMRDALHAAETRSQLEAIWADWLGTGCPDVDDAELRDDLEDHIRNVCYCSGVHCDDVFGNDA